MIYDQYLLVLQILENSGRYWDISIYQYLYQYCRYWKILVKYWYYQYCGRLRRIDNTMTKRKKTKGQA
jgi:hypothetical protein